jgi:hypothetical protein
MKARQKEPDNQAMAKAMDSSDAADRLAAGELEVDPRWDGRYTHQLNIRVTPGAKRVIEGLARRKKVRVSSLVRMWVIDAMRRDIGS